MSASKKILLVYPGKYGAAFPELPLALLYLAHALKEVGFQTQVLDMRLDGARSIKPQEYLFVGISAVTGPAIKHGLEIAKFVKETKPHIPIVWGGIHPSLLPEQTLESKYVDIVAVGEGEETIKELTLSLINQRSFSAVKGIGYKIDGNPHLNPSRDFIALTTIPKELPYELFHMEKYSLDSFPLHTSRGCPYRCGFCYNLAFNKRRWRAKAALSVLDEIEYVIKRFGARSISFNWEDEFFIDKERVRDICEGLVQRGLKIKWDAFCRFNHFYKFEPDFVKLLERSGCASLSFGGESGSERILDEVIKKDIKIEQTIKTTEILAKSKIREIVSFMSGLPEETDADMAKTYQLMDRLYEINPNIYLNGIFLYTPYPGTPLFDLVRKKYNYRIPDTLQAWGDFGIYRNVDATWHPKSYINKYKTISILTRFPFYRKEFTLEDVKEVIGGGRFSRFPYNLIYYIFTTMARWRWRRKNFKLPIEWWLLEKVMERMRGFV